MKYAFILLSALFIFSACGGKKQGINDDSKRNDHWVWWVDDATGKGEWIPKGDQTTVKNGTATFFYYNGKISAIAKLKDGAVTDTTKWFDTSGKQEANVVFKEGPVYYYFFKDGPYVRYTDDGKIFINGIIQKHKPGNIWRAFYDNGSIQIDRRIINDTGYHYEYYEDGKVRQKIIGELLKADDERIRKIEKTISMDQYHLYNGLFCSYYESGNIMDSTNKKNGLTEGAYISHYESGQIKFIKNETAGVSDGSEIQWYENGNVETKMTLVKGKLEGEQTTFYENGKPRLKNLFKNDLCFHATKWDEAGKIVYDTIF